MCVLGFNKRAGAHQKLKVVRRRRHRRLDHQQWACGENTLWQSHNHSGAAQDLRFLIGLRVEE